MAKSKKSNTPLQAPEFRGGKNAMMKFIKDNLRYPKEALANKVEGTVELNYVVNGLGKITEVKVTKGIGFGCDEEAIRIVKSLVFEKVYNRGLNTQTRRSIKINFRLPKQKKQTINYQLVKNSSTPEKKVKPSTTYQISVTIPTKK